MKSVSDESCRENQNTHIMFNNFFFFENRAVCEIMRKKYCTAGQDIDDNKTNTHCMLDIQGYKHTLRICNTYFSTARMVKRTRPSVTLYVHYLSS